MKLAQKHSASHEEEEKDWSNFLIHKLLKIWNLSVLDISSHLLGSFSSAVTISYRQGAIFIRFDFQHDNNLHQLIARHFHE